jgi:hypothetical protein
MSGGRYQRHPATLILVAVVLAALAAFGPARHTGVVGVTGHDTRAEAVATTGTGKSGAFWAVQRPRLGDELAHMSYRLGSPAVLTLGGLLLAALALLGVVPLRGHAGAGRAARRLPGVRAPPALAV